MLPRIEWVFPEFVTPYENINPPRPPFLRN